MAISIVSGEQVYPLMETEAFLREWRLLYEACPWATVFQSPAFAAAAYGAYRGQVHPVLITEHARDGGLTGLLALEITRNGDPLTGAGQRHAEYHAWLAVPDSRDGFITGALRELRKAFPALPLILRYLPPNVPLGWIQPDSAMAACCHLEPAQRPVVHLEDQKAADTYFRKKGRLRTKLNQLKKLGEVEFRRVGDPVEAEVVLDWLIPQYDLRHGAIHRATPFRLDSRKRGLYLDLARRNLLHTTILTVDQEIIAAQQAPGGRGAYHVGLAAYSPFYRKYSPGGLLLALLAARLPQDGLSLLDLTPGGDSYKEDFATGHETVHELSVDGPLQRSVRKARSVARNLTRRTLVRLGLQPTTVRRAVLETTSRLTSLRTYTRMADKARPARPGPEIVVYSRDLSEPLPPAGIEMRKDHLADLLCFEPGADAESYQEFLSRSLTRLGEDHHVCTRVSGGRLAAHVWMVEGPRMVEFPEVEQEFEVPGRCVLLREWSPSGRTEAQVEALQAVFRALQSAGVAERAYLSVSGADASRRWAVEQVGCSYQLTLRPRPGTGAPT
jgi:CelD/BcsL family acetyltransferase involved in cellulose biosynthesis